LGSVTRELRTVNQPAVLVARSTARFTAAEVVAQWFQATLNRTQQFASRAAGSIAVRVRFRTMPINLMWLASHNAE